MTNAEAEKLAMLVAVELAVANDAGKFSLPVLITMTDSAGCVFHDHRWIEGGDQLSFTIEDRARDFGRILPPIAVAVVDANGNRFALDDVTQADIDEITQADIDKVSLDVSKNRLQ